MKVIKDEVQKEKIKRNPKDGNKQFTIKSL